VIVTGDDLGLSPGVTRGILDAFEGGILTSTSLLVDRPTSAAAARAAAGCPGLSVGLHADLADPGGRPLVDLADPAGCRAELARQVERFCQLADRPPTHVDSHRNVHRHPAARRAFREVAAGAGLPLREHARPAYVSSFYGQWGGRTHPEQLSVAGLIRLLAGLPPGWSEVGCHPGYADRELRSSYRHERELELAALRHPRVPRAAAALGITFASFADLALAGARAGGS
jgi:predicted glycoside hydrolase/deacetylase ChbG (UPF0249 family)